VATANGGGDNEWCWQMLTVGDNDTDGGDTESGDDDDDDDDGGDGGENIGSVDDENTHDGWRRQ
jgi:hypothetical protein